MSAMKPGDLMTFHPSDVLKNLGRCDIPAGEFWVHYKLPEDGMNSRKSARLNLKQTASAAHIYGRREAQAKLSPKWNRIVLIGR